MDLVFLVSQVFGDELSCSCTQYTPHPRASPATGYPVRGHSSALILRHLRRRAALLADAVSPRPLGFQRRAARLMDPLFLIFRALGGELPGSWTVHFSFPGISSGELPYSWTRFGFQSQAPSAAGCSIRGHSSVPVLCRLQRRAVLLMDLVGLVSLRSSATSCPARVHGTLLTLGHLQRRAALPVDTIQSLFSDISSGEPPYSRARLVLALGVSSGEPPCS